MELLEHLSFEVYLTEGFRTRSFDESTILLDQRLLWNIHENLMKADFRLLCGDTERLTPQVCLEFIGKLPAWRAYPHLNIREIDLEAFPKITDGPKLVLIFDNKKIRNTSITFDSGIRCAYA